MEGMFTLMVRFHGSVQANQQNLFSHVSLFGWRNHSFSCIKYVNRISL